MSDTALNVGQNRGFYCETATVKSKSERSEACRPRVLFATVSGAMRTAEAKCTFDSNNIITVYRIFCVIYDT